VLLRSQEGLKIRDLELGSPATRFTFDDVAADMRLMMPSSRYGYDSSSGISSEVESHYISTEGGVDELEPKGIFSPIRRLFKNDK
jgi:hypothetical protein